MTNESIKEELALYRLLMIISFTSVASGSYFIFIQGNIPYRTFMQFLIVMFALLFNLLLYAHQEEAKKLV